MSGNFNLNFCYFPLIFNRYGHSIKNYDKKETNMYKYLLEGHYKELRLELTGTDDGDIKQILETLPMKM